MTDTERSNCILCGKTIKPNVGFLGTNGSLQHAGSIGWFWVHKHCWFTIDVPRHTVDIDRFFANWKIPKTIQKLRI